MVSIKRADSNNHDFISLVKHLDAYLVEKDGDDHAFYNQFNGIDRIKYVVIAYEDNQPFGCGAIKEFDASTMEVKRMYVSPESRGQAQNYCRSWRTEPANWEISAVSW